MPGASNAGSYRALLSRPHVARVFALGLAGRLAYGLLPLCLLFTVRRATDSFAVAAAVVASFGVGTLAMPLQARLLDRRGQRRVLPIFGTAFAVVLTLAVALALANVQQPAVWLGIGFCLGPTAPSLGTAMRAQWRWFTDGTALKQRAYALDAVCEEALYLGGPIAASAILVLAPPWAGLGAAALLVLIGTAGLASSPAAWVEPGACGRAGGRAALRRPGMLRLLGVITCVGLGGGASYIVLAAMADVRGHPEYAGYAEVCIALGAITGGLLWGRRRRSRPWTTELPALGLAAAAAVFAASAAPGMVGVALSLAFAAAATAAIFIVAYATADDLVPAEQRTEAGSWLNASSNLAFALGTATAGIAVAQIDSGWVLGAAASALALMCATILVPLRPPGPGRRCS